MENKVRRLKEALFVLIIIFTNMIGLILFFNVIPESVDILKLLGLVMVFLGIVLTKVYIKNRAY